MKRKTTSTIRPTFVTGTLAQLCFAYDQAQGATRDPKRRGRQNHYLKILGEKRAAIDQLVDRLMERLRTDMYSWDVSIHATELAYFSTWLIRRGGWAGSQISDES